VEYFPHDHARSRAYRWGEDGIGGISDRIDDLLWLAMWNGRDPIFEGTAVWLKRHEGNHGEDVKEQYFIGFDPTHSYMRMLSNIGTRRFRTRN